MTASAKQDGRFARRSLQVMALAVVAAAVVTAGCDTVAQIPFSERSFQDVKPLTVTDQAGQCQGVARDARMSMVLFDDDSVPIKPGEDIGRAGLVELTGDDVSFGDGTAYGTPNVPCENDAACGPLHCDPVSSDDVSGERCQRSTGVAVAGEPEFIGVEPDSHAIAVAMSEVGRWRGWFSGDFTPDGDPAYHVFNDSGPNERLDALPVDPVAVDRSGVRYTALKDMADVWGTLQSYVGVEGRETHFGMWEFGEQAPAEVGALVDEVDGGQGRWTTDPDVAMDSIDEIESEPVGAGRSNIYESVVEIIDQGFTDQSVSDVEVRELVVLVAGHDEVRRRSAQDVIDRARDLDVAVSFVHIDPERDPSLLRDDWTYYDGEPPCDPDNPTCSGEADSDCRRCENFEACREPIWYTQDDETDDPDDVDFPREDDRGETFCMPDFDERGRVGPIAEYDRIACETGGSYNYVPVVSREQVNDPLEAQVMAAEGAWEFDFQISNHDDFIDGDGTGAGEAHLLETTLDVHVGRDRSYSFIYDGNRDTRRPFFTPEQ